MERADPVPDAKTCSQCGQRLVFFGHGASINNGPREGLFKCPDEHQFWSYAPASQTWQRESRPTTNVADDANVRLFSYGTLRQPEVQL
jgi:hypothetical protein